MSKSVSNQPLISLADCAPDPPAIMLDKGTLNRIGGRRRFLASALKAARQGLRSLARLQLNREQEFGAMLAAHNQDLAALDFRKAQRNPPIQTCTCPGPEAWGKPLHRISSPLRAHPASRNGTGTAFPQSGPTPLMRSSHSLHPPIVSRRRNRAAIMSANWCLHRRARPRRGRDPRGARRCLHGLPHLSNWSESRTSSKFFNFVDCGVH